MNSINPITDMIERDWGGIPASIHPNVGRFLYSFVRCCQPRLALETGSFVGYSALCIAQAMEDNGQGHLHAFDLFVDKPGYVSPAIGPCSDTLRAAEAHVTRAGLSSRITFHQGDSSSSIQQVFAGGGDKSDRFCIH